jgi:hypothetical protein
MENAMKILGYELSKRERFYAALILTLVIGLTAKNILIPKYSSPEECILDNMQGVVDNHAARAIDHSCLELY